MNGGDRPWEKWDDEGVAAAIDGYWIGDPTSYERAIRRAYAKLVHEYLGSLDERILEVGCGSGLVYAELVPNVVSNPNYTGVDTSATMLAIAHRRHPEGRFLRGDAYSLCFRHRSVDLVISFEVLVHLPDIARPISEMLRVSSRCLIFTVWISGTGRTERGTETVDGREFIRNQYSLDDVLQAIADAGAGTTLSQEIRVVAPSTWAFVIHRGERPGAALTRVTPGIRPSPGLVEELRQELAARAKRLESLTESLASQPRNLEEMKQDLAAHATRIESLAGSLASRQSDLEELRQDLAAGVRRIESLAETLASERAESAKSRNEAVKLALRHDELRARPLVRLISRFDPQDEFALRLPPSFDQLREESSPLGGRARGFRLQHSLSLLRVPFLRYRLVTRKPGLRGILLAVIPDIPATSGTIEVELASSDKQTSARAVRSLTEVDAFSPTLFAFPPLNETHAGMFNLRVHVTGADSPIRLLEWRRYRFGGLGQAEARAFCACVHDP